MSLRPLLPLAAAIALAAGVCAQGKPTAFVGARILPIAGQPIENDVLLVLHGKSVAVGDAATVRLAADVEHIDATSKVIMPGLVDLHSHVGGAAGADPSSPIQPDVRELDLIRAQSPSIH